MEPILSVLNICIANSTDGTYSFSVLNSFIAYSNDGIHSFELLTFYCSR